MNLDDQVSMVYDYFVQAFTELDHRYDSSVYHLLHFYALNGISTTVVEQLYEKIAESFKPSELCGGYILF
jgi:hypothetical protein